MLPKQTPSGYIAYFSMEVGLDAAMPTYSGGLGILAGDTLRAAADLGLPMAGVTIERTFEHDLPGASVIALY